MINTLADGRGGAGHIESVIGQPFDAERADFNMHIHAAFGMLCKDARRSGGTRARSAAHRASASAFPCAHDDILPVDNLNKINIRALRENRTVLNIPAVVFNIGKINIINEHNRVRNARVHAGNYKTPPVRIKAFLKEITLCRNGNVRTNPASVHPC